ncbi:hypothetical protein Tco_0374087 [Tanacetum coccineum]
MVEPEKPLKKKDQIVLDEEYAFRLHAEEQAELERVQRERDAQEEASKAAVIEELDNIQAMIEADEQLAARLQTEEQEQFSIEQKSRMLVEMITERKRSLNIVDYKIYKEMKKSFFQIIKADVKDRFKKTEPENYMDNYLLLTLKIMFEHHFEDSIWKKQQRLTKMFNDVKLHVGYECEMAYELLRLVKRQPKGGYITE